MPTLKQLLEGLRKVDWVRVWNRTSGIVFIILSLVTSPRPGYEKMHWMANGALLVIGIWKVMRP